MTEGDGNYRKPGYRWYVLAVLTLVYTFNFVDRQILVILQEQIRAELTLMDWQLGLLSGLAFAVFYSILGLPIAHYSETLGRKRVIAVALAFWSAMTALSGAAQNFVHLLLIRIGVGVGEAGGSPPSHSIISDIFPQRRRALALSIFSMGVYFGYLVAYSIGGWVAEDLGWRWTFVIVGLPGILLAVLVALTVKEPPRGFAERMEAERKGIAPGPDVGKRPDFGETMRLLWSRTAFRHLALASALHSMVGYGVGNFVPSFIIRAHGMPIGELGWRLALIMGIGGAAGVTLGGFLADKLAVRNPNWYVWVSALSLTVTLPLTLLAFLAQDIGSMWPAYIPYLMISAMWLGPSIAVTHSLVGLRQRAVASAALFFIINLVGLGLGPLIVGSLSDLMRPTYGDADGLRYAIIGTALTANIWAIIHYLLASRTLQQDMRS